MDNIPEKTTIKSRTYEFFKLVLTMNKTNPAWGDVKIPAGNFPKGLEHCEALTIAQIAQILQITVKKKLQDIVDNMHGGGGSTGGGDDGGEGSVTEPVGCAGSINTFKAAYMTDGGMYQMFVNDEEFTGSHWLYRNNLFKEYLAQRGVDFNAYDENGNPVQMDSNGRYDAARIGEFVNTSNQYVKIRIAVIDAGSISEFKAPINPAAMWNNESYELTVCLAPQKTVAADAHCAVIPQDQINALDPNGVYTQYLDKADNPYGIELLNPYQFYITANGEPVLPYRGGGDALWGTEQDPNLLIGAEPDGTIKIINLKEVPMVVRICSRTAIPPMIQPIYKPALSSSISNMLIHTDEYGYQTCIIKLGPIN
ncbi:hypothetical protein EAb13_CDS0058 [Acinetobacter phage EAb13]|nr:hypothetical protein EAb13_CDS0058 [Acinetobacter phage EAb13]